MQYINSSWQLGSLTLPNRLIQGPLAGYSCAPMRRLVYQFIPPAYCVSEMLSAHDLIHKQVINRYVYRAPEESCLSYQISGTDPAVMAEAAGRLQALGADIIDINCGCPKNKIRKKGAGSAWLDKPLQLLALVKQVRQAVTCPLTVKIRITKTPQDLRLAQQLADAGIDALIVHGRRWDEDYDIACNYYQIAEIKRTLTIPVIANGDISDATSLQTAVTQTGCDGFMIGRASTGRPWLFEALLTNVIKKPTETEQMALFNQHVTDLAKLDGETRALLQSKSLIRYYQVGVRL